MNADLSITGDLCGSTYVDAAFERFIKTIVGEEAYERIPEKERRRMANNFELEVKRTYNGDNTPYSVELLGVEDNEEMGIEDDTIQLKPLVSVCSSLVGPSLNIVQIDAQDRLRPCYQPDHDPRRATNRPSSGTRTQCEGISNASPAFLDRFNDIHRPFYWWEDSARTSTCSSD